ncbi:MAG: rhodanese-like domain-containing protein [Pseudomonadota bacterium]|nr:rhodanese-like domain-containing protein [Pseudomonadota bacterium]
MGLFDLFRGGAAASADVVSHAELAAALQQKACVLLDVREPHEFSAGHVEGAKNMPLSRFDPKALPKDKPVILICRSGARSGAALSRARGAGRADVRHYRGGVMGWAQSGGKLV